MTFGRIRGIGGMKGLDKRRWLITGGCGFIGTALIEEMLYEGLATRIKVLDNLSVGKKEDLERIEHGAESKTQSGNIVQLVVGDVRDTDACFRAAKGMDVIVHLAANTGVGPSVEDPVADMENNVSGTLNMLEAARYNGVSRFIFASSGAPVGEVEPPIDENLAPKPVSPYGASKLAGEGYCSAYFRTFGVKTVALRFGNIYGPGSGHKTSVVAKFIRQAIEDNPCEIYGDGNQTRDFVYIEDLVRSILKAACFQDSGRGKLPYPLPWGEIFQIASNREHTINELVGLLEAELKQHGVSMKIDYGEVRSGDVKRNYSDVSKAAKVLGWQPEVELKEGLRRTVEWFLSR